MSLLFTALLTFNTCIPDDATVLSWAEKYQIEVRENTLFNMRLGAMDACYVDNRKIIDELEPQDKADFVIQIAGTYALNPTRVLNMIRAEGDVRILVTNTIQAMRASQ